jgi:putative transposase
MPNYRRVRVAGATYFFTVKLADRSSSLLTDRIADLRTAFAETRAALPFRCDAAVILPDHLHMIWTLPAGDADFSTRWRLIKTGFTKSTGRTGPRSASKRAKREAGLWQRRFWEHLVRDETDLTHHLRYCWANPVKHGLVEHPADWPHSSIHRDIRLGRVDPEWTATTPDGAYGE